MKKDILTLIAKILTVAGLLFALYFMIRSFF
nr:MAG TPA: hypothetical protein [Caudoviricetes sp.]